MDSYLHIFKYVLLSWCPISLTALAAIYFGDERGREPILNPCRLPHECQVGVMAEEQCNLREGTFWGALIVWHLVRTMSAAEAPASAPAPAPARASALPRQCRLDDAPLSCRQTPPD